MMFKIHSIDRLNDYNINNKKKVSHLCFKNSSESIRII